MLTFSIITPTLNADFFLAEAIQSISTQQDVDVEHWIVDGGSTDSTHEIARDASSIHWYQQEGMGQSAAINFGWGQTSGEILSWLNADDLLMPDTLKQVAMYFESHPETEVLYGECDYIDARGEFLWHYPVQPFNYVELVQDAFNYIPQPAAFIRRRVLEKIGGLNEDFHYVMDFDLWLRAGIHCKIDFLPQKLAAMRLHDQAKSIAELAAFAPELINTYTALFTSPDLSADIRALEKKAMCMAYYRASHCAYWGGAVAESRRYVLEAWRKQPWRLRRQLLLSLMGNAGRSLLLRLHTNPHTRWSYTHG